MIIIIIFNYKSCIPITFYMFKSIWNIRFIILLIFIIFPAASFPLRHFYKTRDSKAGIAEFCPGSA